MNPHTSFGLLVQSSIGLVIDHNRFDEPGMIQAGSYVAVEFAATTNSSFTFNDVYSTGVFSLGGAYLLEATNASTNLTVRNNIFFSSITAPGISSGTVLVDAASNGTFAADYNDYFSSNAALGFQWGALGAQGLAAWSAASGGHSPGRTRSRSRAIRSGSIPSPASRTSTRCRAWAAGPRAGS